MMLMIMALQSLQMFIKGPSRDLGAGGLTVVAERCSGGRPFLLLLARSGRGGRGGGGTGDFLSPSGELGTEPVLENKYTSLYQCNETNNRDYPETVLWK